MKAVDALNEYKAKGELVDEVLVQIVTSEIELLLKHLARLEIQTMKLVVDKDEENKQLRKALSYYADEKHYELYCIGEPIPCDITEDGGYIARQALAGESDEK
ncbi:hypothetical protein GY31_01715 [Lysinibacillus sphaericus]|uniref:hypothetical protein n=1 Tax=Lysinibacillus TaxID=400634 RepID=UPI00084ABCC8|nr:hypothetical protein [Lysinibacillus sphaericus]OEC03477.1 hypothetical protein GY31_01715 [Lysinibacillus sphaericus]